MDQNLYQAVTQGNVQRLKSLADKEPKLLLSRTPNENTALHIAAKQGHKEVADEIISRDNTLLSMRNKDGDTPLHIAVRTTHTDVASLLINFTKNYPADIELGEKPLHQINNKDNTVLHDAVSSKNIKIVKELLEADPELRHSLNKENESPLHIAAYEGFLEIVDAFLKFDLVVPTEALDTGTPLHLAAFGGHIKIVEKLLQKNADLITQCDACGNTAVHSAAQNNYSHIVDLLLRKNLTLAYIKNKEGKPPLLVAAASGSNAAIKEILKQCPDASEQVDDKGRNALHIAVNSRMVGSLKCLLNCIRSEDIINKQDADGNTPLHLAAKQSLLLPTMRLLADKRVNPNLVNNYGHTARMLVENPDNMDTCQSGSFLWKTNPLDERLKSTITTYILVATLIASVTFAAIFTMPGGYDQNTGKPLLGGHASFKMFIMSTTIAMCSSVVVIFSYMRTWNKPVQFKLTQIVFGHRLLVVAFLGMLVALAAAVFVTMSEGCKWLAIVVILMCCCIAPLLVWALQGTVVFRPGIWDKRPRYLEPVSSPSSSFVMTVYMPLCPVKLLTLAGKTLLAYA
ncbi:ankyrin repeat-containing protein At5g02620-like [Dioscorea cayenensis subsp. rotundata]|uniref:Ankyrin repeat-containing protein At5g02620-like n=1 Tax=Dioscorea cayennensis subsp. rotundata TaxID=55577 RepID=A0AB40BSG0_DIOCR|nr:ankyrin repeat-containing protein At5g02620-like [Dioscorea cayenensis subsp. rotundata]